MAMRHVRFIQYDLSDEFYEQITDTDLLHDHSIPEDQVAALDFGYEFVPQAEYDPNTDIPAWATGPGVYTNGDQAAIVGSDGRTDFCYLLRKP